MWDGGIQMRGQDSLSRTRQYMHFKRYVKHVGLLFLYIFQIHEDRHNSLYTMENHICITHELTTNKK